jgi:hypothetical protein
MKKVVLITDSVNECDCCGKQNLKKTYLVSDSETGSEFYYGSTCVKRNLGIDNKEITSQINVNKKDREDLAKKEYNNSQLKLDYDVAVLVKHEFADIYDRKILTPMENKLSELRNEIKVKHKIKILWL